MSYSCPNDYTVPRLNWFSNPDVELYDKPTGTTDNDCARAIEENMVRVLYRNLEAAKMAHCVARSAKCYFRTLKAIPYTHA